MADILIVDDNEITMMSVERLLSKEGHNILTASNGRDAINILEKFQFHLVVTDLAMPFVTGLDLIRHIRGKRLNVPIIVVSSTSDEKSRMECYKLGVDNFFAKPVTPAELVAKVRRLI